MSRRFRRVFCALKERSSVRYAKIATFGGFCDLDLIIIKATSPDDLPLPEKYIHQLLKIFSISPTSFHTFSLCFTRRFGRTRCWKVALKCLLLLHRLLRSLPEHSPFRAELLWARSNGLIALYPCQFRDNSSSNPEDYTLFIRSYAQLLDEALACFSLDRKVKDEEANSEEEEVNMINSLYDQIKEVGRLLEVLPQLQSLIDRVMDCRPTGAAARSFIVQSAMKHIIRDSFLCYSTFRREVVLVLDNLIQLPYRSCILSFGIYKKAASQAEELCKFYEWCREKGLCGSYEYPFIERIPDIQIRALETFLNGMWQLTESSSSSSATTPSSWVGTSKSLSSSEDDEKEKQLVTKDNLAASINYKWVKFEENLNEEQGEMMAPLVQLEEEENDNWEVLLDASLNLSRCPCNYNFCKCYIGLSNAYEDGHREEDFEKGNKEKDINQWQVEAKLQWMVCK
ncbi:clathrin assembly protein, putative [Ricinus communis]|uniref:Clathrin assembly protein, putative n=1 Tax=Ricinus communis TaxID=3988 RepID=B9SNG6_RICCO|nr:clathrin assembly protein, putative [Ricinus communis]